MSNKEDNIALQDEIDKYKDQIIHLFNRLENGESIDIYDPLDKEYSTPGGWSYIKTLRIKKEVPRLGSVDKLTDLLAKTMTSQELIFKFSRSNLGDRENTALLLFLDYEEKIKKRIKEIEDGIGFSLCIQLVDQYCSDDPIDYYQPNLKTDFTKYQDKDEELWAKIIIGIDDEKKKCTLIQTKYPRDIKPYIKTIK